MKSKDGFTIVNGSEPDIFDRYVLFMDEWTYAHNKAECEKITSHREDHEASAVNWYIEREERLYPVFTFSVGRVEVNLKGHELWDASRLTAKQWQRGFNIGIQTGKNIRKHVTALVRAWDWELKGEYMYHRADKSTNTMRRKAGLKVKAQAKRQELADKLCRVEDKGYDLQAWTFGLEELMEMINGNPQEHMEAKRKTGGKVLRKRKGSTKRGKRKGNKKRLTFPDTIHRG